MSTRPALVRLTPVVALAALSAGCVATDPNPRATPQRPLFSLNTQTTAPGTAEVEAGVDYDQFDSTAVPVSFKYGISEGFEAFVGRKVWQRFVLPGKNLRGQSDTLIGSRLRIYQDEQTGSAAGFAAAVSVPNGSTTKGMSSDEYDWFLSAIYDGRFEDGWTWTSFYQVQQLGSTGASRDTAHAVSFETTYNLGGDTDGFAEITGILDRAHSYYPIFAILGVSFAEQPTRVWDVSVQMPINEDAGDPTFRAGVTYNLSRASEKPLHP
ncbi:MAG: hypothetical protein H6825_01425 [Planctomycetes bacterium]|nr:hypothetical protein [Planctomycetota bacterium]